MSHIAIVGRSFSGLRNKIHELGHEYTVLKDVRFQKDATKKYKHIRWVDFSTRDAMIQSLASVDRRFDAIICTYENYVLPAAQIAEFYGLPGLPPDAAEACTDKYLMRSLFSKAPKKISPDFAIVSDIDSVISFAKSHTFPIILKPANLAKSLLVTKNHDLDELTKNYQKSLELLNGVYEKYAPNRKPKMIIEEFMEGTIHSVDAFVDVKGTPHMLDAIVDYQTGYDIGFDDNFHYSRLLPSELDQEQQQALKECAELGIRALGMKNSPAHIEIIMTNDGPRIVEIGARNGGYRERMHELANGVDVYHQALQLALGRQPDTTISRHEPCAVLELFPKITGVFEGISHQPELMSLSSLSYFSIKAESKTFVGKSSDGYKMCAVIILHNKDADLFNKDLAFVNQYVLVKTSTSR